MTLSVGSIVSTNPVDDLCTAIKNLCGIDGLANWSFIENIPIGVNTDEWQTLTLTGWGTGDSFKLTYNAVETGAINYASDIASAIAAALNAIAPFVTWGSEITCAKIDVANYVIKFSGARISGVDALGLITVTSAVGCSGSIVKTQTAVPRTGSASYSCDVFKCAGTGDDANDAGTDWYIGVIKYGAFPTSNWNTLLILLAEGYNSTTKRFSKIINYKAGAPNVPFCSADANSYGYSNATDYNQNSINELTVNNCFTYGTLHTLTLNSTGFRYWITMTNNFFMLSTRVGVTQTFGYFGLMDSLVDASLSDTLPLVFLCSASGATGAAAHGAFTKIPGVTSTAGIAYSFDARPYPWNGSVGVTYIVPSVTQGGYDIWKDQKIDASRVMVWQNVANSQYVNWGCIRGLVKDEIQCINNGGSVGLGDTVTIDGEEWTVVGINAGACIHLITKG